MTREEAEGGAFDEALYLKQNPDVAAALRRGEILSGLEHCLSCGLRERRPGVPAAMSSVYRAITELPPEGAQPPADLRVRVHGSDDLAAFHDVGKLAAANIASAATGFSASTRVLDFGCGCGRVLRFLQRVLPSCEFHGSDIDPQAIRWCQQELSHQASFSVNAHIPPLPYPPGYFELIYAVSVFSHLPEEMELRWLEELSRVSRPDSVLLLSVHGEELLPAEQRQAGQALRNHGFHYSPDVPTGGLPSFYGNSYHTRAYITRTWAQHHLEVQQIVRRGIVGHQDLVICRPRR